MVEYIYSDYAIERMIAEFEGTATWKTSTRSFRDGGGGVVFLRKAADQRGCPYFSVRESEKMVAWLKAHLKQV